MGWWLRTERGPDRGGQDMTRLAICLSVACAALVTVVAVVSTSGARQAGPPTGTLDLVIGQRDLTFKFVDNPPLRKESAGDRAVLTGGDTAIEGVTDDKRAQEPLPIVGGTGSYAGARGVVVVTDTQTETRF